uniref:Uncharacterized protein n=1 Tax=Magallana gigas TaxID=29159 RepID=A0A8W8JMN9_MAGGI
MVLTSQCPQNRTEVDEASKRIGCGIDVYGNNQYMCLPNEKKSSLVEFCFDGLMGIEEKGNCLENSNGKIRRYNCTSFSSGCPNTSFYKHNVYEYPACQLINTQSNCYVMEPSCPPQEPNGGQNDDTKNDVDNLSIIMVFLTISFVFVTVLILLMIKLKRNRTLNKEEKPQTMKTVTQMERIDKLDKKLLTCKEDKSADNENDGFAYACTNYTSLDIDEGDRRLHSHTPSAGWCPVGVDPSDVGYGCECACNSLSMEHTTSSQRNHLGSIRSLLLLNKLNEHKDFGVVSATHLIEFVVPDLLCICCAVSNVVIMIPWHKSGSIWHLSHNDDDMPILIFIITQVKTITKRCAGSRSHGIDVFLGCHFGVVVDWFL